MKRLTLLIASLLLVGAAAAAKDVMNQPEYSKEVMEAPSTGKEVAPEPMEEVVETPAPYVPAGFVTLRLGGDVYSSYDDISAHGATLLDSDTKDFGYEIAVEAYKSYGPWDIGLGVAYQDHANRESKDLTLDADTTIGNLLVPAGTYSIDGGEFKSVPVYLTGRYNFNQWGALKPYLKANVGYSFNFDEEGVTGHDSSDIDDGLYWAAGIGMAYNWFEMDVLYGVNEADLKVDGQKYNNDYERVTVSLGYRFDY